MKIIFNKCFGGFQVSDEGYKLYAKKKKITLYTYIWDKYNFGTQELIKSSDTCNHLVYYLLKDYGNKIKFSDRRNEDIFYLNASHRTDPILIEVVEELGNKASTSYSNLKVISIPDDIGEYIIDDYDGFETLHKKVTIY